MNTENIPTALPDPKQITESKASTKKRERTTFENIMATVLSFALLLCLFIRVARDSSFAFAFVTDILGIITESYHLWLYTKVDGKSLKSQWLNILCIILFSVTLVYRLVSLFA